MNREELMQAVEDGFADYEWEGKTLTVDRFHLRLLALRAVQVFEQAHTPADDERGCGCTTRQVRHVDGEWSRELELVPCEAHRRTSTTPTDDEREYDRDMAVMLSQLVDDEPMWSCVVIAKKLHAAGFRRTVQGEP